jgi:hypothetical protein
MIRFLSQKQPVNNLSLVSIRSNLILSSVVCLGTTEAVYWSEFLATDPEVPSSILGATRFSEK